MAKNQKMLVENEEIWGDNVRIIGLSIENTNPKHQLNIKGWDRPEHLYSPTHTDYMTTYDVQGLPHMIIVDKRGLIAFKGHPGVRKDIENDINELFNGQRLSGEGCEIKKLSKYAQAKVDGYIPDDFHHIIDPSVIMKEMDEFVKSGQAIQKVNT